LIIHLTHHFILLIDGALLDYTQAYKKVEVATVVVF